MNTKPKQQPQPRYRTNYLGNGTDFPYQAIDNLRSNPQYNWVVAQFFNEFDAKEYTSFMNLVNERNS